MNKINPIIKTILNNKGIINETDIDEFLSFKPQKTYDPFLLLNMEAGVDLILKSIKDNECICIYGDYDADGITSISILIKILKELNANVFYYIPSRFNEGYGLNNQAIEKVAEKGADLLITVDCGTASIDEVEYAKNLGLKVIITDHHSVRDVKPNCLLINPKQEDCSYPFKGLAGCGVAFKLAQALQKKANLPKDVINEVLDIVAIGTIGDIVPLVDENRTIAKYGLWSINKNKRDSIIELTNQISKNRENINSEYISYGIVPHLNAAGRMDNASIGVEFFLSNNKDNTKKIVNELVFQNNQRKKIQNDTYRNCMKLIKEQCEDSLFPIIYAKDAHEGITGIVAGKLKEELNKPIAIVTPFGEYLKGTSRSVDGIDLYALLKKAEKYFVQFGGHKGACGFKLKKDNLEDLRNLLNNEINLYDEKLFKKNICGDFVVSIDELTLELAKSLEMLEPYGCENEKPTFEVRDIDVSMLKTIGEENNHLSFNAANLRCIYFNFDETSINLETTYKATIIGKLNINRFRNVDNVQFIVEHMEAIDEN
ncbi:MAG: single-stranded-DNA-specific exonuclease RecJ [Anaerovoracaceae bacterium]